MRRILFFTLFVPLFVWAQDLFFSEYVEGSSYNKAIEIYNPTDQTIDLSGYMLKGTSNAATDWEYDYTFPSGATIGAGETYVFCDGQASTDIQSIAEWVAEGYECGYNGNDSRGLFKQNGSNWDLIDVIGDPNNPSETMYSVAGVSEGMLDHTIIRKSTISSGNINWTSSSGTNADDSEWIVMSKDDISDLGQHTYSGSGTSTGDGKGSVVTSLEQVNIDSTLDVEFTLSGVADYTLANIQLTVPESWTWSGAAGDIILAGTPFTSATVSVNGDTVLIEGAQLTDAADGTITIANMTSPSAGETSVFYVKTAEDGGTLTGITQNPSILVVAPATLVSIADIQNDFDTYDGQTVIIEAVVTIGVNVTRTDRTDAYVQDESGRGINLSDASTDFPLLVRGNKLRITGAVSDYSGTTQIGSFSMELISSGNEIPGLEIVSTADAGNIDHEGTMIETIGIINDKAEDIGGGTNITINDGSGDIQMRIWDSSGLDLSAFSEGDTMGVRGIIDTYNSAAQLLVGYQDDVYKATFQGSSDGKGTVSVSPNTIEKSTTTDLAFTFSLTGSDTLATVELTIPSDWTWGGTVSDLALADGFSAATASVNGSVILLENLTLTSAVSGGLTIQNMTSSDKDTISVFTFRSASKMGTLTELSAQPSVVVGSGTNEEYISMSEARSKAIGSQITVKGVISIGSGLLSASNTSAYIQGEDGYGMNIFQYGSLDANIKRGNEVIISGELDEYNGVLEITNYTTKVLRSDQEIPAVRQLYTAEAAETTYEGSFCQVSGVISEVYTSSTGSNIYIDDGSGSCTVRVWASTGIDVSGFEAEQTITVLGALSVYNSAGQILVAYQDDVYESELVVNSDGSGTVTMDTSDVEKASVNSLTFTMTVDAEDTLDQVELTIPNDWNWTSSESNVSLSGDFSGATVTLNEKVVLLSDLDITGTSGELTISNLTAPDADTSSVFTFRTASPGGTLRDILQSPVVLVGIGTSANYITIAEARKLPAGSNVTVLGTVVIGANILRSTTVSAYIFDDSRRGIDIYNSSADATLKRGNLLLISGVTEAYVGSQNDTTLEIVDYTSRVIKTNNTIPEAIEFSPTQADTASTQFEGSWATVEGKITSVESDAYGINMYVGDNFTEIIVRINNDTGIDVSEFSKNDYVSATGIIGFYRGDIQIQPGYQEDIYTFEPESRSEYNNVSLTLPAHPFVPEKGERLTVDYTINNLDSHITIRIFDLSGRLIKTLFDGPPYNEELSWNGRNQINELVTVGTYICHLEVVNNETGKRQVKVAPIVVGTVLSR